MLNLIVIALVCFEKLGRSVEVASYSKVAHWGPTKTPNEARSSGQTLWTHRADANVRRIQNRQKQPTYYYKVPSRIGQGKDAPAKGEVQERFNPRPYFDFVFDPPRSNSNGKGEDKAKPAIVYGTPLGKSPSSYDLPSTAKGPNFSDTYISPFSSYNPPSIKPDDSKNQFEFPPNYGIGEKPLDKPSPVYVNPEKPQSKPSPVYGKPEDKPLPIFGAPSQATYGSFDKPEPSPVYGSPPQNEKPQEKPPRLYGAPYQDNPDPVYGSPPKDKPSSEYESQEVKPASIYGPSPQKDKPSSVYGPAQEDKPPPFDKPEPSFYGNPPSPVYGAASKLPQAPKEVPKPPAYSFHPPLAPPDQQAYMGPPPPMHEDDSYYAPPDHGPSPNHGSSGNGPPITPTVQPPDDQDYHDKPHSMAEQDLAPPPYLDQEPKDHFYFHDVYHEVHHTTTTTTTTAAPRAGHYSYYYLGRKLWYIPLYFSLYFIVYVTILILKSIARHKIQFSHHFDKGRGARELDLDIVNKTVVNAIESYENKYM